MESKKLEVDFNYDSEGRIFVVVEGYDLGPFECEITRRQALDLRRAMSHCLEETYEKV